ncbi:hypothetical protein BU23DRAFT_570044 [Bimuria novae-zelandiae CBS 107.79]|uniref:Uncharacterized protein n=1 Tax=Bimuria novae-zelandiae CBS 107.79 TaxID=1447943 RepID=A0A6A5V322_9PLEO|nr:hypothetical protein BU23DRAFT_570044 [Bimuria novae-zelandiae CBS 107.79]
MDSKNSSSTDTHRAVPAVATNGPSTPLKLGSTSKSPSLASYYKTIAISCAWVVLPMTVFTAVVLWMIFHHKIAPSVCPNPDMCLTAAELNNSISGAYIVDFSAAHLVFIASWSSTVSFMLTGVLMTLHGFSLARRWLRTTQSGDSYLCPTPYQTSLTLRLINAEGLVLGCWAGELSKESSGLQKERAAEQVLNKNELLVAVFGSDTYLHIATEAIELNEVQAETEKNFLYSRVLEPFCWNHTRRPDENVDFWGCGVNAYLDPEQNQTHVSLTRGVGAAQAARWGLKDLLTRTFLVPGTQSAEDHIALLMPIAPSNIDYKATSFGVSTQCQAVGNDTCTFGKNMASDETVWDVSYTMVNQQVKNLTKIKSNSTVTGSISMAVTSEIFLDGTPISDSFMESYLLGEGKVDDERIEGFSSAQSRALVPKAAVWLLVAANLVFASLAIVFAGFALVAASPQVHQLRLNIAGLAAQGFEGRFTRNKVEKSEQLFEERNGDADRLVKRVCVEETEEGGGAGYVLLESWESSSRQASYASGRSMSV